MTPDYVESLPYVIYVTPAVVIFFVAMLLGPTALPLCLMAIESAQWGWNRWKKGRNRYPNPTDDRGASQPRRLTLTDLRSGTALACLAVPIAMASAYATFAWYWVWVLPGVSTVLCAHWWLRLRRGRILHAEVYAIALWMAPNIVWGIITLAILPLTNRKLPPFFYQEVPPESMLGAIFGGPIPLAIAAGSAVAVVAASLILANRMRQGTKWLSLCLILTIPCATYFWFAQPFGFAHIGFTAIIAGYAITKESRRSSEPHLRPVVTSNHTRLTQYAASVVCVALSAAALWLYIPYLADLALWDDGGTARFVLTQTVLAGTLGMLVLTALTLTSSRAAHNYRAAAFGIGAMLLFAIAFNLPGFDEFPERWTMTQWLATTATCATAAYAMWRIFGPGAIANRAQETELTLTPEPPK